MRLGQWKAEIGTHSHYNNKLLHTGWATISRVGMQMSIMQTLLETLEVVPHAVSFHDVITFLNKNLKKGLKTFTDNDELCILSMKSRITPDRVGGANMTPKRGHKEAELTGYAE